ncbi:MlaA family lipoprotein [Sphingomonas lycopersici]|uniref:VacJ family lipoprotein n=1 Tax=Sphingomonas lycopersici TaxID=2951807 RepID=A0AA42CQ31_9SPHN|nr:VacJ family lipoprotein [Sphingomonas lycopersici]MCW6534874.1 VacJ family lipoprotein [Sphingomonas lycopersici]
MSARGPHKAMLLAAAGILACTGATATAQGKCSDIVVSGVYCSVDIAIADHALPASRVDLLAPGIARPLAFAAAPVEHRPQHEAAPSTHDVVVTGRANWEAPDPLAKVNLKTFEVTQEFDKALLAPIALAYKDVVPKPVRDGVHNFIYNMREPVVFLNFLLQLKIGRALETAGRFVVNTTVGVAGVFDMAKRKPFKWRRRSNGFANTLGFYGVKSGPFLFLPIVGPTTPRDLFGGAIDRLLFPFIYGRRITRPQFTIPLAVLGTLDHRAEFDDTLHQLHDGQPDPYARSRDFYLQRRQNEIDELKGKGRKNSSPMSEAPTLPITVKERSPEHGVVEPSPTPPPADPPHVPADRPRP